MIEAVTYGMIPSAKSEKRESAWPENARAAPARGEEVLDRVLVDARRGHPGAEPVEREDQAGEENTPAKLGDAPGVREPGEHYASEPSVSERSAASGAASDAASGSGASTSGAGFFRCFGFFFSTGSPRSQLTVPPTASIFSRALFEKACAETVSFFLSSPLPRIFTSVFVFLITPASTSASRVTSVPSSKRSSCETLTGMFEVLNGPIGIASFDVEPRCFGMRM